MDPSQLPVRKQLLIKEEYFSFSLHSCERAELLGSLVGEFVLTVINVMCVHVCVFCCITQILLHP